jgi:hypothetical protein
MNSDANDFVSILVPRQHVTKVYGLIASLESGNASPVAAQAGAGSDGDAWPEDLIVRQYRESPESMKKFQRFLAEHPGQEFSTSEMAEPIGAEYGWNSVAGALGAYGRRVKNRYKRDSFPFQSRWDHEKEEQYHSMTAEVAEVIKSI